MPKSKIELYKKTNKFLWTICLYQNSKYIKTTSFYERYASVTIQNV